MAELYNVRLDEALLLEVRNTARAQNKSVDEVIQDALQAHIRERAWSEMIEEARERTEKLGIREDDVNDLIDQFRSENRAPRQ